MIIPEIAGYVVDYAGSDGPLCYGFGETEAIARMRLNYQVAGMGPQTRSRIKERVVYRPVGADEASEIMEMLDTPW